MNFIRILFIIFEFPTINENVYIVNFQVAFHQSFRFHVSNLGLSTNGLTKNIESFREEARVC